MQNKKMEYGVLGLKGKELSVPLWLNQKGEEMPAVSLADFKGKFKVLYCFQAWCPGCHSKGLPDLKEMVKAMNGRDDVVFLAIQTVFEGRDANTFERVKEIQREYGLAIPFGHDPGNESTGNISTTMINYRTGGTPWFIFIDKNDVVVFNDYHLEVDKAIDYLVKLESTAKTDQSS